MMLLMLRCEYIEGIGKLTPMGTRGLSTKTWRIWNKILMVLKPGHQDEIREFLATVKKRGDSTMNA